MSRRPKPVSRLHSRNPVDAAWRAQQADVDSDIAGLSRDPKTEAMIAEMRARGLGPHERIKILVKHFRANKRK